LENRWECTEVQGIALTVNLGFVFVSVAQGTAHSAEELEAALKLYSQMVTSERTQEQSQRDCCSFD
jgi:hypothetical protein